MKKLTKILILINYKQFILFTIKFNVSNNIISFKYNEFLIPQDYDLSSTPNN